MTDFCARCLELTDDTNAAVECERCGKEMCAKCEESHRTSEECG